jgi:hypothetical protein
MPIQGREVLAELRARLDRAREHTAGVRREYEAVDKQVDELIARRGEAIVELAKHDLPDISHTSIERTFAEIRDELRTILGRKERAQAEMQGRLARFRESIREIEQKVAGVAAELNSLVAKRTELEQQAADRLKGDAEFQRLSQQALQSEMMLKANEERAEELQREADEKLPAYQSSRLFQYLLRQKFGTPAYVQTGWTRSLDRWLARLIEFERHRRGYEVLKNLPALVAAEVEKRRNDFNALMEQVEAIEDRVSDEVGLTQVQREGEERGAVHEKLTQQLTDEQGRAQQVEAELTGLDQQQSRFYSEALERYVRFLGDTESAVLEARARQTSDPVDDEIASRIAWLTNEVARMQPELNRLSGRAQSAEQISEGLSFVVRRGEQADLDSDRCTTTHMDRIDKDIDRFLSGGMNENDLWNAIREQMHFEPTWVESTVTTAGNAMSHPVSQVLLSALAHAAVTAVTQASPSYPTSSRSYRSSAQRSVERRAPQAQARRVEASRPAPSKRFTTRGGF